jgi:phosphohistidine phosphatase
LEIYILRHGIAVPGGTPGYSEMERPLTEEGRDKMLKAAKGIAAVVGEVDVILTSPLKRAHETTLLAARVLGGKEKVVTFDPLKSGTPLATLLAAFAPYQHAERLMVVGHEPDLSLFASALIGVKYSVLALKKGGLCRIDVGQLPPQEPGVLRWLLTPGQLRAMGGGGNDTPNAGF